MPTEKPAMAVSAAALAVPAHQPVPAAMPLFFFMEMHISLLSFVSLDIS
jgi:hypothetical protein